MFKSTKINWIKKGLIIRPNPKISWMQTHCMIPTPEILENGLIRLFYSGRDGYNRSHIGYSILDLNDEGKILDYATDPVLAPGSLGCFDDNGVTPSCIKSMKDGLYLYYIGWNPGSTVRMHLFGGLAISQDGGQTFQRWSRAPIIERCPSDPFLNTAPWVVNAIDGYRMYYVSGCGWVHKDLPRYNIKIAYSKDGKFWQREGQICIDFKDETENALARPYVIFDDNIWKMWFSYKRDMYRIGYAESLDGIAWHRKDELAGIDVSPSEFDSDMIEYASIVKYKGQRFMFYNGNGYGVDGVGMAVEE